MSEPAEEWWEAVRLLFDGSREQEPDVGPLVRLLRNKDKPLPEGFRDTLAELLDSRQEGQLACNWQLRPRYVGRADEEQRRVEKERLIDKAMAGAPSKTEAIARVDDLRIPGLKGRTIWRVWSEIQSGRAWWNRVLDANVDDDELKERIRRNWRP